MELGYLKAFKIRKSVRIALELWKSFYTFMLSLLLCCPNVSKHFPSASKPLHAPFPVHSSSPLPGLLSFFIIEKDFLTPAPPHFFSL